MTVAVEDAVRIVLRGGNRTAYNAREREVLVEGPRGTGKTRTILEKLHNLCHEHPGLHVGIFRKYQKTLAGTCLTTFNEQVVRNGEGVYFFGGNDHEPAGYRYRNGSRIVCLGLDDPEKVKSAELDIAYVNEVTEVSEDEWESLLPLLRHQINGVPFLESQRLYADCNPANSGHWMNQRCDLGKTRRIKTTLRDNPIYFGEDGQITEAGVKYMATLSSLTGARRERWLDGLWTGVENACYPMFDRTVHMRPLEPGLHFKATIIWVDYGAEHNCSVGAMSLDQFNRRWIRECWGRPDTDQGHSLNLTVAQFKERYHTTRGRVDPNQSYLAGQYGFGVAKGGSGGAGGPPRLHRIDLMEPLFYRYPGGRVPSFSEEKGLFVPQGPFAEPDSPGIFLVEGMPGNDELANQLDGYHYIFTETPKGKVKDVYRKDEDHVAGMEYANEEWEEGSDMGADTFAFMRQPEAPQPEAPLRDVVVSLGGR